MGTKFRERNKLLGLCIYCNNPADGLTFSCKHHREKHRLLNASKNKKYRPMLLDSGRCLRCSAPLISEMDDGFRYCLSCRGRSGKNYVRGI
jgi:hypothetical protein